MLLVSRRKGETLTVGDDFRITVEGVQERQALIVVIERGLGCRMTSMDRVIASRWVGDGQPVAFAKDCSVEVVAVQGDKVRLGIAAPPNLSVHRLEVYEAIRRELGPARGLPAHRRLHDNIGYALSLKFGEAADPLIDDIRQITDVDMLWLIAVSIDSAASIDDVRRIYGGAR